MDFIIDKKTNEEYVTLDELVPILNQQSKQISDLEAKLAENEMESSARYRAWQEEVGECDRLRVALADVRKQLEEKDKEITQRLVIQERDYTQDKISFALEQLEKVKEFCQNSDGFNKYGQSIRVESVVDFIDCAIEDLKGKK